MIKKLLSFFLIFVVFWGCGKLDPKIDAPSYIQIDNYTTVTDSNTQGTSNQTFTDVLITSSTQSYGYYPIPGKIPIPLSGNDYISIRPVIKVNGVSYLRVDYPMMRGSDTNLILTRGQVTKVTPVFKYFTSVKFRYLENFQTTFSSMSDANPADTFCIKIVPTPSFPDGGSYCLLMQLDNVISHTSCQAQTASAIQLPTNGTGVYLEINYKCNTAFEAGIIGTNTQGIPSSDIRSVGGANATTTWKKMYFSLTDVLRSPPTYNLYYIYFRTTYDTSNPLNLIYIDNIKVVSQV